MNSSNNSRTNESNKFIYEFTDKLNLKNLNKNMGLSIILSIYYTWKNIKSDNNNNKVKYLLQFGMMNLIYLMDHKIADEITSVGKSKSKEKEKKMKQMK